jgi:hypothetical protein
MRLLVLDGHDTREVDITEWMAELQIRFDAATETGVDPWRVALTEGDGWGVSTVFLGCDHGDGPFETLVHAGGDDVDLYRYDTWEQAEAGHVVHVKATQP